MDPRGGDNGQFASLKIKSEFGDHFDLSSIPAAPGPGASNPQVKIESHQQFFGASDLIKSENKDNVLPVPQSRGQQKRDRHRRFVRNAIIHRTGEFRIRVHFKKTEMQLDVDISHRGTSSVRDLKNAMNWAREESALFSKLHRAHIDIEPAREAHGWLRLIGGMVAGTNGSISCQIRVRRIGGAESAAESTPTTDSNVDPSFCFLKPNL